MSAAQLFSAAPLVVCLTPGAIPKAEPYRIPRPEPAGLHLKPAEADELTRWLAEVTKRGVFLRFDGEAFLLWGHLLQDIAKVEINWIELCGVFHIPVPPERPRRVVDDEEAASCWHAWNATRRLQSKKQNAEDKSEEQDSLFGERETPIPESSSLVFADVETTGGSPKEGARVVQIALARLNTITGEVDEFSSRVNPEGVQSLPGAYAIHRIPWWELNKAPRFGRLLPRVLELLTGAVFVAHNSRAIDEPYLKNELSRVGVEWPCIASIDSLRVARKLFPHLDKRKGGGGHSLGSLASIFVVEQGTAHDAAGDVQTLMGVWQEIRRRYPKVTLTEMARY